MIINKGPRVYTVFLYLTFNLNGENELDSKYCCECRLDKAKYTPVVPIFVEENM